MKKGLIEVFFFRGQVDKYTWVDIGSSYLPSDMLAAYLFAQLEKRSQVQVRRKQIWDRYYESLLSWATHNGVTLPFVPGHCDQAYHMFYLLLPTLDKRQSFIAHLKRSDILSVFHYLPLHLSPMGQKYDSKIGDCPVTESISDKIVRLPFYYSLSLKEQQKVIDATLSYTI